MGPVALIADELSAGRLLAPIPEPATRTRGYFFYAPKPSADTAAIAALREWLVSAGRLTENEYPAYLTSKRL
jgi:LysR family transcriptional regulator, glycine cleavage system transcriptional activator